MAAGNMRQSRLPRLFLYCGLLPMVQIAMAAPGFASDISLADISGRWVVSGARFAPDDGVRNDDRVAYTDNRAANIGEILRIDENKADWPRGVYGMDYEDGLCEKPIISDVSVGSSSHLSFRLRCKNRDYFGGPSVKFVMKTKNQMTIIWFEYLLLDLTKMPEYRDGK